MGKGWYERRAISLRQLGYADYKEYLASQRWANIRRRVMRRARGMCEACQQCPATEVHHRSYCIAAMKGRAITYLVACCRDCHEKAEFDRDRKTSPSEANQRMAQAAYAQGIVLPGVCKACRSNPTKRTKIYCRRCEREGRQMPIRVLIRQETDCILTGIRPGR